MTNLMDCKGINCIGRFNETLGRKEHLAGPCIGKTIYTYRDGSERRETLLLLQKSRKELLKGQKGVNDFQKLEALLRENHPDFINLSNVEWGYKRAKISYNTK